MWGDEREGFSKNISERLLIFSKYLAKILALYSKKQKVKTFEQKKRDFEIWVL